MFCTNCGKEIEGNVRFCPECGALVTKAVEKADDRSGEKSISPEPRIGSIGDLGLLRQMTEKAGKTKKAAGRIAVILMLVYAFLTVRGLLNMLQSVLDGKDDIMSFVFQVFVIILFTCGLLHIGLEIILPFIQGRKAVHAEEYLKYIQVNDRRALMHALGQMKCAAVKSVYMDEHGDVCVAGKKSKHTVTVQNGMPVIMSKRDNYKAVLERETIAACLLKFLVPEAPINAYENEKSNLQLSRMRLLLAIVAALSGLLLIVVAIVYATGDSYINMVKNGYPELYPNITYREAFDAFFGECEWEYFESEDGRDVVEFHGNCMYGDEQVLITIQFLVYEDKGTFEIYTAAIDGEEQPALVYSLLLLKVFESYNGDGERGKLQLEDFISDENDSSAFIESEEAAPAMDLPEGIDNSGDWNIGQDNTVTWESIRGMSGRWSDGNVEVSVSIYSDAEEYVAYSEVGTCFFGEILGTLCFIGSDETSQYLMCELDQGDCFTLQYWGGGEMKIVDATEGLRSVVGVTLYCEEHYES
ncbi:MAG: zinc ribbon domain-containing protein [Lachnospiraceae bacterium]|nr:zinc ribbon domain-containing protein [Lachnospiraceae bacterium]